LPSLTDDIPLFYPSTSIAVSLFQPQPFLIIFIGLTADPFVPKCQLAADTLSIVASLSSTFFRFFGGEAFIATCFSLGKTEGK
jgi:hypothetical protein